MPDNPELIAVIHDAVAAAGGRLTFAQFMELTLYHPVHGYYARRRSPIGKAGDYFTSVSVGPLFGRILAREFQRLRAELGNPADFQVIEFGGHRGQLRADVLATAPELAYTVVEVGDSLPAPFTGVVFSNEFLDALPVHRVVVAQGEWRELHVTLAPQSGPGSGAASGSVRNTKAFRSGEQPAPTVPSPFAELPGPLSDPRLATHLAGLPVHLMEGYRTEVNLRALDWLAAVAARLRRGYVVTIDYGWERQEYFAPHHRDGSLQCYHRHTRSADPYIHIGDQDITAHVDFSALMEHGRRLGLETVRFTDQAHYLLDVGEPVIAAIVARDAGRPSKERQAIHQLIHPELMGRAFRVLVLQRRP